MTKAMREAKRYSNWSEPNEKYEAGVHDFTEGIFSEGSGFKETFLPFVKKLSFYGMLYSLCQVVIKIAAPGIPDIYQGNELWDLSMVDPDNRRPVDFEQRKKLLTELETASENGMEKVVKSVQENWEDGRIKMFTTWRTLQTRKAFKTLFTEGNYMPLQTSFTEQAQVLAFARQSGNQWCLVAIPLNVVALSSPGQFPVGASVWKDETIELPENSPTKWINKFTNEAISGKKTLALKDVFATFPVALLIAE
jgi:(1->4)-alpha-D-glucan 1-alpha-D-glucosylmutase